MVCSKFFLAKSVIFKRIISGGTIRVNFALLKNQDNLHLYLKFPICYLSYGHNQQNIPEQFLGLT